MGLPPKFTLRRRPSLDPPGVPALHWMYLTCLCTPRRGGVTKVVRLSRKLRMINIESRLPALEKYFAGNPDIIAAYLYGSYGTSTQTVLSDVDLGILLREGMDYFDLYLAIQSAVIEVTREEDVNVLILNDAPVIIQYEVIATGRLLYERSAAAHLDFIERVLKRYPDFALDFRTFCAEYDQSLREAYLRGQQE